MAREAVHSAADYLPPRLSLAALRRAAAGCEGCALYSHATQTVFGEGRRDAAIVMVGEQPGDREDLEGRPFIGPAGGLLDRAIVAAGLERPRVYVTNAVKHFKWEPRGKRRIHKKPQEREIAACRPWLAAEVQVVRPRALVCLGVTAARAAFGHAVRLRDHRGRFSETPLCSHTLVTIHPSALLRLRDAAEREAGFADFVSDLRRVRERVGQGSP